MREGDAHLDPGSEDEVSVSRIAEPEDASEPIRLEVPNLEERESRRL